MDPEFTPDVGSGPRRAPVPSARRAAFVASGATALPGSGPVRPGPPAGARSAGSRGERRDRSARRAGSGLPRLAAAGVALIGALVLLAGGLQATVLAPAATTRATLASADQPVITSTVGLLGLDGPRVRIQASDSRRRTVFAGIGRAADVDAYLAEVRRARITGHDGAGTLRTEQIGSQPSLPDPAGVDVWVTSVRGPGAVELTWPDAPGQWRLLVATDGTEAVPDRLDLTWSGRDLHSIAPVLIAIGLVLLVVGAVSLTMLRARAGLERY